MLGPDDKKITVESFMGLYSRSNVDEVPVDHAQDCLNLNFTSEGKVKTRQGLARSLTLAHSGIRRFFLLEKISANYLEPDSGDPGATEGKNLLHLDNSSNLYIGDNNTPLLHLDGMTDFSAININNRTYISPNNGSSGFLKGRLKVLNAFTASIRDAAGHAPSQVAAMVATESVTSGNVSKGVHKFAVIYETDTGFWTPPGPKLIKSITGATQANPCVITCADHGMVTGESHKISGYTGANWGQVNDTWHITRIDDDTFSIPIDSTLFGAPAGSPILDAAFTAASVTCTGDKAVDLASIPVGPSYVKRRLILATRADEEEFFFVPNVPGSLSEINNNTDTTTTVNFDDESLVASADYLFDILEAIPAGSAMCKYRGRLVLVGPYLPGIQERALLSNVNDIETFNWVSGYIQVQTERDGNDVRNCFVLRDTLYLSKFTGTFATEDNGNNPSTWAISVVDAVIGCYAYGSSTFTVSQSAPDTGDIVLLASRPGLYLFDGVMRRPELSYKIQSIWLRINFPYFHRVTVSHDPWNHLIFVACPLDSATEPNTLLVCDYSDGRDAKSVRWGIWSFHKNPTCIGMAYFGTSSEPVAYTLKVGSIDSSTPYLYTLKDGATNDDGSIISSYYTPGPFRYGGVDVFKLLVLRAWGVGRLTIGLTALDGTLSATPPFFTLGAAPGRELYRQINLVNEKMNVKLSSGTTLNDYMTIDRLDVWGVIQWPVRPTL